MWFCIANLARQLKHLRLLGRSWDLRAEPLPGNAASFSWQERLNQLRQAFAVFIIAVFAIAKLTAAQAATETTAMKYYVGKWSCVTRPAGHPQLTFANHCPHWLYHHARRLTVPAQRTLLTPEGLTAAVTYATEKRHYVQTQLHYDALWSRLVSEALDR